MRYHHDTPTAYLRPTRGKSYRCEHPAYSRGTLYSHDDVGLVVIQQRYDPASKRTWWNEIDPWLVDEIHDHEGFKEFFDEHASKSVDGIFPTFTVRQVMWALRMKPLEKHRWETVFDRKPI